MSSNIVIRCLRLVVGWPYKVWIVNTHEHVRKHRDIPSAITALSQIVVSRQASKADRNEQHHQPEERAVSADAGARVLRATIEALTTLTAGVWDFAIRCQVVPLVAFTTLGVDVCISWRQARQQDTLSSIVSDIVEFAVWRHPSIR